MASYLLQLSAILLSLVLCEEESMLALSLLCLTFRSKFLPSSLSDEVSNQLPNQLSDGLSYQVPDGLLPDACLSYQLSNGLSDEVSNCLPNGLSNQVPNACLSYRLSDECLPNQLPNACLSHRLSDACLPYQLPNSLSNQVPNCLPYGVSDCLSYRLSYEAIEYDENLYVHFAFELILRLGDSFTYTIIAGKYGTTI